MEKSKRLFYIEILQAFGILCVFLGHALRIYHDGGWYFHKTQTILAFDIIDKFIYSFHMPLFMFLSGFLFYLNKDKIQNAWEYVLKRVKRLLLPFYLAGFLYVLPMICFINPLDKSIGFYYTSFLTLDYTWHLWFLIDLFIITLFFVLYYFKFNKINKYVLLVVLIGFNLLATIGPSSCLARIPKFAIFFYLGCLFVEHKDFIEKTLARYIWVILSIFAGAEILLYFAYKNVLIDLSGAVLAILSFYLLALKLSQKTNGQNKVVSFLSVNLLSLYIIHEPIMALILKYFKWGNDGNPFVVSGLMFFVSLLCSILFIKVKDFILNKTK
ncbi:acyltransferase [bacterium]|nr:acyltransferase [bacterium]